MKRIAVLFSAIYLLFSCNNESQPGAIPDSSSQSTPVVDTAAATKSSRVNADTSLLDISRLVLKVLKEMDFDRLASYVNPEVGLRFSPYAFTDTTENQVLTPYQLKMAAQKSSVLLWGSYDGTGDPIKMNIKDYFKKFVYDKDFLNAPQTSIDKVLGTGNSLNNFEKIYPGAHFTEFYFPGFDKKYDGMDWETLRLVFQQLKGKLYLVAIIHDQWTI